MDSFYFAASNYSESGIFARNYFFDFWWKFDSTFHASEKQYLIALSRVILIDEDVYAKAMTRQQQPVRRKPTGGVGPELSLQEELQLAGVYARSANPDDTIPVVSPAARPNDPPVAENNAQPNVSPTASSDVSPAAPNGVSQPANLLFVDPLQPPVPFDKKHYKSIAEFYNAIRDQIKDKRTLNTALRQLVNTANRDLGKLGPNTIFRPIMVPEPRNSVAIDSESTIYFPVRTYTSVVDLFYQMRLAAPSVAAGKSALQQFEHAAGEALPVHVRVRRADNSDTILRDQFPHLVLLHCSLIEPTLGPRGSREPIIRYLLKREANYDDIGVLSFYIFRMEYHKVKRRDVDEIRITLGSMRWSQELLRRNITIICMFHVKEEEEANTKKHKKDARRVKRLKCR